MNMRFYFALFSINVEPALPIYLLSPVFSLLLHTLQLLPSGNHRMPIAHHQWNTTVVTVEDGDEPIFIDPLRFLLPDAERAGHL